MKTLTIIALGLLIVGYANQKGPEKSYQDYDTGEQIWYGGESYRVPSAFDTKFEIEKARLMYDFSEFQE